MAGISLTLPDVSLNKRSTDFIPLRQAIIEN